eukprot:7724312-Pyramimonas_sp.AAC.1
MATADAAVGGDDPKFQPCETIYQRPGLKNLKGAALLEKLWDMYAVTGQRDITVKFFTESGQRTMKPHPLNERRQDTVVAEYTESIKEDGNVAGVRGDPWAVFSPGGQLPYLMISYGTLSRAVYRAAAEDPKNKMVKLTLKQGLRHMTVLDHRTPDDVIRFLIDFHNDWHKGSTFTLLQMFNLAKTYIAAFKANKAVQGDEYGCIWDFIVDRYPEKDRKFKSGNEMVSAQDCRRQPSFSPPPPPFRFLMRF